MRLRVLSINDVAERQMCCGCGVCAYLSPRSISMVDTLEHGRRPLTTAGADFDPGACDALQACPGIELEHMFDSSDRSYIRNLIPAWGPVLEVWEGYATDPEIRFAGSSGGAASALALYAIERGDMHGLLHIAARRDVPYLNHTILSTSRWEILAAAGSRYAPASPCDGLQQVEDAPAPCVFIGKPCDVAGTFKARRLRPKLDRNLGLTIAIFCAGTPSTQGTLEMLERMGVDDLDSVRSVRYRGMGWPGNAVAVTVGGGQPGETTHTLTYEQSWGEVLQRHRPWRCHTCVDHSGEFADIAVGDPWYRPPSDGDPGRSLVLARTERGRQILREAVAAGYLFLERADSAIVEASQRGFPSVRGSVWARIWTSWLMGAAAPAYRRMPMARFWWSRLTFRQKLQSVFGTARRVFSKRLRNRVQIVPYQIPPRSRRHDTPGPAEPAVIARG